VIHTCVPSTLTRRALTQCLLFEAFNVRNVCTCFHLRSMPHYTLYLAAYSQSLLYLLFLRNIWNSCNQLTGRCSMILTELHCTNEIDLPMIEIIKQYSGRTSCAVRSERPNLGYIRLMLTVLLATTCQNMRTFAIGGCKRSSKWHSNLQK